MPSAASPSAASEAHDPGPSRPVRTCIGCRQQAPATALLRIVVAPRAAGEAAARAPVDTGVVAASQVVPDVRRRLAGRGAWLHPDPECVSVAQRRRAFARALRVPVADPTPVLEHVMRQCGQTTPAQARRR